MHLTRWPSNLFAAALRARMSFPSNKGLRADSTMKSAAAFRALVSVYTYMYVYCRQMSTLTMMITAIGLFVCMCMYVDVLI
jgi:hypothetical protein